MRQISLCMIVKDEEDNICKCLNSVKDLVDEIIIVDTGSKDRTKELVSNFTEKIYDFEWVNDFSKARNFSFSKATKDYILWLDADDVFLEEDRKKFLKLKKSLDATVDIYMMKYLYSRDENGNPLIVQRRERLLKREKNYKWQSPIHEVIVPTGIIKDVDITVTHNKKEVKDLYRNLKIFEQMEKNGEKLDDRQEYCYAKELYFLKKIDEAIVKYETFVNKYIKEYKQEQYLLYQALIELSDCYKQKGQTDKEWQTLMVIIENQIPEKECLNKIADIFLRKKQYKEAIYWFEKALENTEEENNKEYNNYLSNLSIGICYYWLGYIEKAIEYNEKAGKIRENDSVYLRNKEIYLNHKKYT